MSKHYKYFECSVCNSFINGIDPEKQTCTRVEADTPEELDEILQKQGRPKCEHCGLKLTMNLKQ